MVGCNPFVFVNGQFDLLHLPNGVRVTDLWTPGGDAKTGICVRFSRGVTCETPLHFLFLMTPDCLPSPLSEAWHVVIIAEEGSQGVVFEEYQGEGVYCRHVVSEWKLEANAILKHYKVQNEPLTATHESTTVVIQSKHSQLMSHVWALGTTVGKETINVALQETGAQVKLYGLYMAGRAQRLAHYTQVDHCMPHTVSEQLYKGVIGAQGQATFQGRVQVHVQAQQSRAQQHNPNLLLADDAAVYSQPELEIYTDAIQCRHGATVGQLDENALFYLRSRGLDLELARTMLIQAFADEITSFIPTSIAAAIDSFVGAKMGELYA